MELGVLIEDYIKSNNISMREFARRADMSPMQIHYYVKGTSGDAKASNLRKLAKAMNISFGDFIECLNDEFEIEFSDSVMDELMVECVKLTKEEQNKVLEYAKFLRFSRTE